MPATNVVMDERRQVNLNFALEDQLMKLVRVRIEPFSIEMPSKSDVENLWKEMGVVGPLPNDTDMARLERRVWECLPRLRKALTGRSLRLAKMATSGMQVESETMEWESKIRDMSFGELAKLCEVNGLEPSEQTNPGLRVMQTRNRLYAKVRKEGHLIAA